MYHKEAYNDCSEFLGVENMVKLKSHCVDQFCNAKLAKVEEETKEKAAKTAIKQSKK